VLIVAVVTDESGAGVGAISAPLFIALGYIIWSAHRRRWTRNDRPADAPDEPLAELVTARVGEPVHVVARFVLQTQHGPQERWHGQEPLWMAVSDTWVWLLYQTHDGNIGGVKSRFSRAGMHTRWTDDQRRSLHRGELSWPADPWFIAGELQGPRPQRLRLIGLLAGDELGVRHLVTRSHSARANAEDDVDPTTER
jgi:hypothetical protein